MKKFLIILFFLIIPSTFAIEKLSIQEKVVQFLPLVVGVLIGAFIVYKFVKKLLFVAFAAFFIIIGILVAGYYHSESKSIIDDKNALEQIQELQKISSERSITLTDINGLKEIIKGDKTAEEYYEEMKWLITNNESEHALHSLAFLKTYVKTGDATFCIPHELEHVEIYLKHNQTKRAMDAIIEIKDNLEPWIQKSENAKKQFPQYYKNFDTLKNQTILVVDALSAQNFTSEIFQKVKTVEENGIC